MGVVEYVSELLALKSTAGRADSGALRLVEQNGNRRAHFGSVRRQAERLDPDDHLVQHNSFAYRSTDPSGTSESSQSLTVTSNRRIIF